jgi:hypothetical protein
MVVATGCLHADVAAVAIASEVVEADSLLVDEAASCLAIGVLAVDEEARHHH